MRIADMHCDTISRLLKQKRAGQPESLRENTGHLDLMRMQKSGYQLQNFALFVNLGACQDAWEKVCALHTLYEEELARNQDVMMPFYKFSDREKAEQAGKMSALLTVEEGGVCGGSIERLRELYGWGVRMMTLTWNYPNELGCPAKPAKEVVQAAKKAFSENTTHMKDGGLTEKGREFVFEMERLGMLADVSHLSDKGFYEVAQIANQPFVASHSNAREICGHPRNMTDDMIRRLAECGGCIGLNFYRDFLTEDREESSLQAAVRQARHMVKIGGMEVLGLGSDFDGIDTNEELPGAQSVGLLWEALHKAGFSQGQLDKIFYQNVMRVYREVLN